MKTNRPCASATVRCATILFGAALALATRPACAQSLPGLTINGNTFSYSEAGKETFGGILYKPAVAINGTHPGILLSHGTGPGAMAQFVNSPQTAMVNTLTSWGFVVIGPDYKHKEPPSGPEFDGYSAENSRRARKCLEILAATPAVDTTNLRIAAYGHSRGAFLTLGLCAETGVNIKAAFVTGAGARQSRQPGAHGDAYPIIDDGELDGSDTPLYFVHGTRDNAATLDEALLVEDILIANSVPYRYLIYEYLAHDTQQTSTKLTDIFALMRAWFTQHGVLLPPSGTQAPTITAPATVTAPPGQQTTIPIAVTDDAVNNVTVSAFSTADTPSTSAYSAFFPGRLQNSKLQIDGSGTSRTLTIEPDAGVSGEVEIALTAIDSNNLGAVTYLVVDLSSGGGGGLTAPTNLTAAPATGTAMTLGWSVVSGAATYEIQRKTGTGAFTTVGTATSTAFTDSAANGLAPATSYTYQVRAINGSNSSPYSSPVSATTYSKFTATSSSMQDGFVQLNTATTLRGVTSNGNPGIRAGRGSGNLNFRGIVSFNTEPLLDTATIVAATLRLKRSSASGMPFSGQGTCKADIESSAFNSSTTLETADYDAAADATLSGSIPSASNGTWAELTMTAATDAAALGAINPAGTTQLRVYFTAPTGNSNNFVVWSSGEATVASGNRPQLVIEYQ